MIKQILFLFVIVISFTLVGARVTENTIKREYMLVDKCNVVHSIQGIVGAYQDGKWGAETEMAVITYQEKHRSKVLFAPYKLTKEGKQILGEKR